MSNLLWSSRLNKSDYKTITRNSHYYIIGHLSSVVKPGAVRIGTKGYTANSITYLAFERILMELMLLFCLTILQKSITLVTEIIISQVPAKSVVSYRWKK